MASTTIYVHVSTARLQSVKSPLERLQVPAPRTSSQSEHQLLLSLEKRLY
jgi:hypothetical protein